jgi:hypothetical protein
VPERRQCRVGEIGKPSQRPFGLPEQVVRIDREQTRTRFFELGSDLGDGPHAYQRIAVCEIVVEHTEWQARHEGVYPDREARQFYRQRIEIDDIDTAPRDQPSQQLAVFERHLIGEIAELNLCSFLQLEQLRADARGAL